MPKLTDDNPYYYFHLRKEQERFTKMQPLTKPEGMTEEEYNTWCEEHTLYLQDIPLVKDFAKRRNND